MAGSQKSRAGRAGMKPHLSEAGLRHFLNWLRAHADRNEILTYTNIFIFLVAAGILVMRESSERIRAVEIGIIAIVLLLALLVLHRPAHKSRSGSPPSLKVPARQIDQAQASGNSSEAQSVEPQYASQMIEAATTAFRRDLPHLLRDHPGEWVAYHGATRLGFSQDEASLYRCYLDAGIDVREFIVEHIEPQTSDSMVIGPGLIQYSGADEEGP